VHRGFLAVPSNHLFDRTLRVIGSAVISTVPVNSSDRLW
jgi:hypothetical protein